MAPFIPTTGSGIYNNSGHDNFSNTRDNKHTYLFLYILCTSPFRSSATIKRVGGGENVAKM